MLKRFLILALVLSLTVTVPPAQADNEGFEITKIAQELGLDYTSPLVIAALSTLVLWFGINTIKAHFAARHERARTRSEIAVNNALEAVINRMVKDKESPPQEVVDLRTAVGNHRKNLGSCLTGWARLGPYGYGAIALGVGASGLAEVRMMAKARNKTLKELEHEKIAKEVSAPLDEMSLKRKLQESDDLYAHVSPAVYPITTAIEANMGALRGNLIHPSVTAARGIGQVDHEAQVTQALKVASQPVNIAASLRTSVEWTVSNFRKAQETPAQTYERLTKLPIDSPDARQFTNAVTEKFVQGLMPGIITSSSQYETFFKQATRERMTEEVEKALRSANPAAGVATQK